MICYCVASSYWHVSKPLAVYRHLAVQRMMPVFSGVPCAHVWCISPRFFSLTFTSPPSLSPLTYYFFLIWRPLSCSGYATLRFHRLCGRQRSGNMVGRRAGAGGRGGAAWDAKRSAARCSKASGRVTASHTGTAKESLFALVQGERSHRRDIAASGGSTDEDVTVVYRKPRTRQTKQSTSAGGPAQATVSPSCARAAVGTSGSTSAAPVSTPEMEVCAFLERACSDANRTRALANCAVADVALHSADSAGVYSLSQEQLFGCSGDRMETARRALHTLKDLLYTPVDTLAAAGAPCVGYPCWVPPEQYATVVALARVCEAAVPLQLPPLLRLSTSPVTVCQQDCTNSAGKESTTGRRTPLLWRIPIAVSGAPTRHALSALSGAAGSVSETTQAQEAAAPAQGLGEAMIDLVPSPVLLADVHKRLGYLRRFHQLQVAYGGLIPAFRAASTAAELRQVLFTHNAAACQILGRMCHAWRDGPYSEALAADHSGCEHHRSQNNAEVKELLSCFLGNPLVLDTVLPFVGITARYPQEEALLQSFVAALKDLTAVETASWGPVAAMTSWRCTDGLYVVHHASRVHVLRRLLNEAQFYGLPLFLRSIRAMANNSVNSGFTSSAREGGWQCATALQRAQRLYADQFFLTPDNLDPDLFSQPDPMQAQVVQEELVALQRTHCAFCLVVGEADEVLTLVHRHMQHVGGVWQSWVKKEEGESLSRVKTEPIDSRDPTDADAAASELNNEDADKRGTASVNAPGSVVPFTCASVDPLRRYVARTLDAAQRRKQTNASSAGPSAASPVPFSHVQWIEHGSTNRWSPNAHYYGLGYMVVLEMEEEWATEDGGVLATEGLLPEKAIVMNAESSTAALRAERSPAYCVNAIVELWRT
ncbi:hypothetical protein, conserved [Leishmania tarentolae]|uniref:Uncharacterized protein n=1 Tax=Leishmania tarentolae TaxID=5689 RepID=A0A640KLG4_LEITA|nr:hypothetical protein, conserved [Leishmania tarentolae]